METKVKRPPSVWITQILLVIFALIFLLPLILLVSGFPLWLILIGLLIDLAIVALCLAAFWGLAKRQMYGRWLGVSLLVLEGCLMFMGLVIGIPTLIFLIFTGLYAFLIYRLAFGSAANTFFAKPTSKLN